MLNQSELDAAFNDACAVISYKGSGFDTYNFRREFIEETAISIDEKKVILDYLNKKMKNDLGLTWKVKREVDRNEFETTDYYSGLYTNGKRGSYFPVIAKTVAGLMALSLAQQKEKAKKS